MGIKLSNIYRDKWSVKQRKVEWVELGQSHCGLWVRERKLWYLWGQESHPLLAKGNRYASQWWSKFSKGGVPACSCICTWLCLFQILLCPWSWLTDTGPQMLAPFPTRKFASSGLVYFSGIEKFPVVMSLGIISIRYLCSTMNCFLCVTLGQEAEQNLVVE